MRAILSRHRKLKPAGHSKSRSRLAISTLLFAIIAVALSACSTKRFDPFIVPAKELRGRIDTVALSPLTVSSRLGDRAELTAIIEPMVTAQLTNSGIKVVPMSQVEELWRSIAADLGPIYDQETGELDEDRHKKAKAAVYRELALLHGTDAVLEMRVRQLEVYRPGGLVTLCGVADLPVYWPMGIPLDATLARGTCLAASLHDIEMRQVYGIQHGLEMTETFADQTHAYRPIDQRSKDTSAVRGAVRATVAPLAEGIAILPDS